MEGVFVDYEVNFIFFFFEVFEDGGIFKFFIFEVDYCRFDFNVFFVFYVVCGENFENEGVEFFVVVGNDFKSVVDFFGCGYYINYKVFMGEY